MRPLAWDSSFTWQGAKGSDGLTHMPLIAILIGMVMGYVVLTQRIDNTKAVNFKKVSCGKVRTIEADSSNYE